MVGVNLETLCKKIKIIFYAFGTWSGIQTFKVVFFQNVNIGYFHTWFNDEKSVFGDRMFFSKLFFDFLRQPGGRIEVKPELNFRSDFLNILSA